MGSIDKPIYVLFFSQNCKFSNKFVGRLNTKSELTKKVKMVDIDVIPQIPDEVSEVPALYDGKNIFCGKAAFKWLDEILMEYLSPADEGLTYSFVNGQSEQLFNNFSLLDQKNGSFGMGNGTVDNKDPTRMMSLNENSNKNMTLDQLVQSREKFK